MIIDECMFEDFKTCIFKCFAILCGAYFSSCYLKGADNDKEALKDIPAELVKGV